jgi:hypothetical protein
MKTRNIIAIFAALPIMAGMTGCKSDEELTAKPANEILIVEGGNIEMRSMRSGDESKKCTYHCQLRMGDDIRSDDVEHTDCPATTWYG